MSVKNSFFLKKQTLNCRGKLLIIQKPLVMGILNLTPDSFYDGGKYQTKEEILNRVQQMVDEGVALIDIGGMSSRPGADIIDEQEELARVVPAITLISENFPDLILSIDTVRSAVAEASLKAGAHLINDISAGEIDNRIFEVAARYHAPYILMHMQGNPQTMQMNPKYDNVVNDVMEFFTSKAKKLKEHGVVDVILDAGIGFGKNLEHNFELLSRLDDYQIFQLPILVGISRKSIVNSVLKTKPENALNGSTVLHSVALLKGANILRVHDIRAATESVALTERFLK